MGIQGLLPALKSIMTPGHIRDHAGKRAALDTSSFLRKAAYTCCKDICEGNVTSSVKSRRSVLS
jgi:exonuclease-1